MNKQEICQSLKSVSKEDAIKEWNTLKSTSPVDLENLSGRSKLGCNLIDYFFFHHRLETIGNKGIHFFDFLSYKLVFFYN